MIKKIFGGLATAALGAALVFGATGPQVEAAPKSLGNTQSVATLHKTGTCSTNDQWHRMKYDISYVKNASGQIDITQVKQVFEKFIFIWEETDWASSDNVKIKNAGNTYTSTGTINPGSAHFWYPGTPYFTPNNLTVPMTFGGGAVSGFCSPVLT